MPMSCSKCWAMCCLQEGFPQALNLATSAVQAGAFLSFQNLGMLVLMCYKDGNAAYARDLFSWALSQKVDIILDYTQELSFLRTPHKICVICQSIGFRFSSVTKQANSSPQFKLNVSLLCNVDPSHSFSIQCQLLTYHLCCSAITSKMRPCSLLVSSRPLQKWEIMLDWTSCGITSLCPGGWTLMLYHGTSCCLHELWMPRKVLQSAVRAQCSLREETWDLKLMLVMAKNQSAWQSLDAYTWSLSTGRKQQRMTHTHVLQAVLYMLPDMWRWPTVSPVNLLAASRSNLGRNVWSPALRNKRLFLWSEVSSHSGTAL